MESAEKTVNVKNQKRKINTKHFFAIYGYDFPVLYTVFS